MEEYSPGVDSGQGLSTAQEGANTVTSDADKQRVAEAEQGAKDVASKKQKSKAHNTAMAAFLTHLMKSLHSDQLFALMYELFFVRHDHELGVRVKAQVNDLVLVGFFVPFFMDKARELGMLHVYQSLFVDGKTPQVIPEYLAYIKQVAGRFHNNIPLDSGKVLLFVLEIIRYFQLTGLPAMGDGQHSQQEVMAGYVKQSLGL